jgi:glycine betaine catabolism A
MSHRLEALLDQRRPGFSLPQAFYLDAEIFAAEMEAVFGAEWLFACNECEIKRLAAISRSRSGRTR